MLNAPHSAEPPPPLYKDPGTLKLLLFFAIALTGVGLSLFTPLRQYLTLEAIRTFSHELGAWGPIVLFAYGLVGPLLLLPRWPVCFVGGILYGIVWGSVLGNVAGLAGAWLHYVTSRTLVATSSDRLLRRMHLNPERWHKKNAFWVILFLRAVPISNSAMINIMAGALRISLGAYLASSFLGMIPSTVMYATGGKMIKKPDPTLFVLAFGILFVMMLGTVVIRRYLFRKT